MVKTIPNQTKTFISSQTVLGLLMLAMFSVFTLPSVAQINSVASGTVDWNNPASWVGGVVPGAGASVVIQPACTMRVNVNTAVINNVTVNGFLDVLNSATSTLTYNGNMVLNTNATLRNNGGIVQSSSTLRTFSLAAGATYIHNPRNLTNLDESIFEKSTETFALTSNLIIQKWFDLTKPLGSSNRVQQPITFGNVTLNIPDVNPWEQNNQFMTTMDTPRILGTLMVSSGIVRMDDGAGNSDFMEFNDVVINGTGSIIFISGPTRPAFVLVTDNFTDVSTSTNPTVIMDNVFNMTFWTVNGSVTLGHNFYGIVGSGVNPGGSLTVSISGNLVISGGAVQFVSMAFAGLTLNVNGSTTISGTPTKVRFIDGNAGNLSFSTNNFTISGGADNVLMGGNGLIPSATGTINININNNFTIDGVPSNTSILDASSFATGFNNNKLRVRVGNDFLFNSTNSNFAAARHRGATTFYVTNNFTHTAGRFNVQIDTANAQIDSLYVGGALLMNTVNTSDYIRINYGQGTTYFRSGGNFTLQRTPTNAGTGFVGIYGGGGNMFFSVGGIFSMGTASTAARFQAIYNFKPHIQTGNLDFIVGANLNMIHPQSVFRGIDNQVNDNSSTVNFTVGNLNYSGGNFSGFYSSHTAGGMANFSVAGLLQITFNTAATDTFTFIGLTSVGAAVSDLRLTVNVNSNFNITGANGLFVSTLANGREVFTVNGEMNVSGGKNSFNSYPLSGLTNAHPTVFNIGSNLAINGGSTYMSANNDSLTANIGGNMSVTLGELIVQGGESGPATLNVAGGFTQTGGNFFLHKNTNGSANSPVEVTINSDQNATGNFQHTGGVITFTTNTSSPGSKILNIFSPTITYGGTGSMTMANPGTNIYSGVIRYGFQGTSSFNRTTNTHSIQQIEQQVLAGCTLVVTTGSLQIASLNAVTFNRLLISSGGVLDVQTNQIFSNGLQSFSGVTLLGRLRLARAQGFYDGTSNAALNATGNLDYRIFTNSVVEYNGHDNQIITGMNVGVALASSHKYSILDINFTGTPNTEFVYPTNVPTARSVIVRHKLILTNGELNLDNDRISASGGRSILIERDSVNAITRVNGYIRSEVYDSSASVIWRINSMTGQRIIPFGKDASNYIPFTYELTSGTADTLIVSTYGTPAADNLPYPPSVPNVNGLTGTNNSVNTVDRFWYIQTTNIAANANLRFTVTPSEMGSVVNPRAQAWMYNALPTGWSYPIPGTQSNITNGTLAQSINNYQRHWWTLAGLSTPLPVSLVDFNSGCDGDQTVIRWVTSSELNNDHFSVLKSRDGINYEEVGRANGAGTTNSAVEYSLIDETKNYSLAYYKLIQNDYDGKQTVYGPVIAQPCSRMANIQVTALESNPGELSVIIKNPESGKFALTLTSADGKHIASKTVQLESGLNLVNIPVHGIATGVYFVNVKGYSDATTLKVPLGFSR
jgi:hypothetical protein